MKKKRYSSVTQSIANDDYHSSFKQRTSFISIGLIFSVMAILMLLTLVGLGLYINVSLGDKQKNKSTQLLKLSSQSYLSVLNNYFKNIKLQARLIATDPVLVNAFIKKQTPYLNARATQLSSLIPYAYRVNFITTALTEPNSQLKPPITETCLLLKQQAKRSKKVQFDIHGSPKPHLDIVHPVLSSNKKLVGYVLMTLQIKAVRDIIRSANLPGYVELQIKALGKTHALVSYGDASLRQFGQKYRRPVASTKWHLTYWIDATQNVELSTKTNTWIITLLSSLILILIYFFLYRVLMKRLRKDQVNIVNLLKDIKDRNLAEQYATHLKDFQGTVSQMLLMAQDLIRGSNSVYGAATNKQSTRSNFDSNFQIQDTSLEPEPAIKGEEPIAEFKPEPSEQSDEAAISTANEDERQGEEILDGFNLSLDEIQADELQVEESELNEVSIPASVFKAYDMRGIVEETLTPSLVYEIGRAIGSEAIGRGQNKIVIARDGRLSGPELRDSLSQGLQESGCQVTDIGMVPTPTLYYAAHKLSNGTGVMITGSHNPPNYNGLKLMIEGQTYYGDLIQGLRKRIEESDYVDGKGGEQQVDVAADYLHRITSDVKLKRPMKVVIDCGNGVAGNMAPQLFTDLGCEVIELFCEVDGTFPNHHPDPSKPENIIDVCKAVKANQADIGFAFDGDGDRLGVIDNTGKIIWPDRVLMILAQDVLSRNPGAQIIYDVKCTRNLASIIEEHGGKPLMWKTGHSFIKAKIQETGALLAGEMSGHIFIKERWYGFDDALYAGARLLEVLAKQMISSHQVFSALPDAVNTPELNIHLQEGEPMPFMDKLKSQSDFGDAKIIDIDGIRVEFADGWGLVRSSNTTPTLVLRFEADSKDALLRIQALFKQQMLAVKPDLKMPF